MDVLLGALPGGMLIFGSGDVAAQLPAQPERSKPAAPQVHGPHLDGDGVTLPLVLVKGYPFLEGSINGKRGKLLFDVGEAAALAVDTHTVSVPNGVSEGHGFFGSGQTFDVMRFPVIDTLTLAAGLHFEAMTNIRGNPGLPLEQHITPDFIGWIGVRFWEGYVFRLDYGRPAVTFYRDDGGSGERRAEAGDEVAQTIPVSRAKNGLLYFPIELGDVAATGVLDTGSHDAAWMTDAEIAALEKAGTLRAETDGSYTVSGLRIGGRPVPSTKVEITRGAAPFAKGLSTGDGPIYQFGYEFLSRQRTVWDYGHGTVTLLGR